VFQVHFFARAADAEFLGSSKSVATSLEVFEETITYEKRILKKKGIENLNCERLYSTIK
jgi:hypothetical protein